MKTTLEIPEDLYQSARSAAEARGCSLKDYVADAIREKVSGSSKEKVSAKVPWLRFAGVLGKSDVERSEMERIQGRVDKEFGQIDSLEK